MLMKLTQGVNLIYKLRKQLFCIKALSAINLCVNIFCQEEMGTSKLLVYYRWNLLKFLIGKLEIFSSQFHADRQKIFYDFTDTYWPHLLTNPKEKKKWEDDVFKIIFSLLTQPW